MTEIREETAHDRTAVFEVNRAAFGRDDEAVLVDALRDEGATIASLVAVEDGRVAGHVLFTDLEVEGAGRAAALAPVAVLPPLQNRGLGSKLIARGLELCRERGAESVIVVGHAAYYPRFGFSASLARPIASPFRGDEFMALELRPGALRGVAGPVRYARAFGLPAEFTRA